MKSTVHFFLVSLLFLVLPTPIVHAITYRCVDGKSRPAGEAPLSLSNFAESYLGAPLVEQPAFVQDWLAEKADTDGDGRIDPSEQDRVVCEAEAMLRQELPELSAGPLVGPLGDTDWPRYYASRDEVTGLHLKIQLAAYGRGWAARELAAGSSTPLADFLETGTWSVAHRDSSLQQDLLGRDQSVLGRLEKQLELAYRISQYKTKLGVLWPELRIRLMTQIEKKKSFPFLIYAGKRDATFGFNWVTPSHFGIEGSTRYYVLIGTPLTLSLDKADVWREPAEQLVFILTESQAYPETLKYVTNLRKKLQRLCTGFPHEVFSLAGRGGDSVAEVEARMQNLASRFSEAFMEDEIVIEWAEAELSGGDLAHHDVAGGKLQFAGSDLRAVRAAGGGAAAENRYLLFLFVHEYIHYLQSKSGAYEMNARLYNQPQMANLLFGHVGYREYYLAQPLERDAQGLAAEFVQMLNQGCKPAAQ